MANMKTLVVIRDRQQSSLEFRSKAKAEIGPGREEVGKIKQHPPDGAWVFYPAMFIFGGLTRCEMGQISHQMEQ